jgi:glycosyltransferase involved in cell wall biosynthesis
MMRVAMLIQAYLPHVGGAERQLSALIPLLRKRGVEVIILTRRYAGMSAFETIDGTPVIRFAAPGPKPVAMLAFVAQAVLALARLRPDVIHAHELLSPASAALLAKRLFRTPVVAKVLRGGALGDIDKLRRRPFGARRLAGLRDRVDAFISISSEIDAELATIGVEPARRLSIPNGVDTGRFRPAAADEKRRLRESLGLPAAAPLAVFSGRLVPEKRVDRLLAAWPFVRENVPGAELVVLGAGEEEAVLRDQAGAGVRFAGQVEDVLPWLQAADVFVLPSATEGLSNALLEALACGLGAVATAVGGAPDVIVDGESGLLVPPDDTAALAAALVKLLGDPILQTRLGAAGRKVIETRYSLEQTAGRLAELYARLARVMPDYKSGPGMAGGSR